MHAGTRYIELVFLHPVESATCSVLWCIRVVKHRHTIFYAWVGPVRIPQKCAGTRYAKLGFLHPV
jgi:hypothetical protein